MLLLLLAGGFLLGGESFLRLTLQALLLLSLAQCLLLTQALGLDLGHALLLFQCQTRLLRLLPALAALRQFAALDVGSGFTNLHADGLGRFAVGGLALLQLADSPPLQGDPLGIGHVFTALLLAMALPQEREKLEFLLVGQQVVRPALRQAGFAQLGQETLQRNTDDFGKLSYC